MVHTPASAAGVASAAGAWFIQTDFSSCCLAFFPRASVRLFELGVHTPGSLFWGVRYVGCVDFQRFDMTGLPIFGVILGILETTKM